MRRLILASLTFVVFGLIALFSSCTSCPDERIDAIMGSIPDPSSKHQKGDDLKGWTYEYRKSPISKEVYYYYHMPSKKKEAPVFVLVHGMFLDGRTFLNFGPLSSDFELYALETPQISRFYTGHVTDFAKMLQDFLDTLSLKKIYLGGVSLGGQIVMYYMMGEPTTQVDGLALIATDMVKDEDDLRAAKKNVRRVLGLTDDDDRKMMCVLSKLVDWKKKRAGEKDKAVLELFSYKKPAFYRQVMYAGVNMEAPPPLEKIHVPTLIVLGDDDSTIDFEDAEPLKDCIKGAELKVVENGEHDLAYTRADEVIRYIREKFAQR